MDGDNTLTSILLLGAAVRGESDASHLKVDKEYDVGKSKSPNPPSSSYSSSSSSDRFEHAILLWRLHCSRLLLWCLSQSAPKSEELEEEEEWWDLKGGVVKIIRA